MGPSTSVPGGQDWGSVNVGRSTVKRAIPKTASGIAAAKKAGLMASEKKFGAPNQSAHNSTSMSARKLEETDELKHNRVDKSLSKAIMQARMAKKMTQKDLATAINEKPQVIGEYENGKAIPNGAIIVKIERKLGCKLPRPGKKKVVTKKIGGAGSGMKSNGAGNIRSTGGGPAKRR